MALPSEFIVTMNLMGLEGRYPSGALVSVNVYVPFLSLSFSGVPSDIHVIGWNDCPSEVTSFFRRQFQRRTFDFAAAHVAFGDEHFAGGRRVRVRHRIGERAVLRLVAGDRDGIASPASRFPSRYRRSVCRWRISADP